MTLLLALAHVAVLLLVPIAFVGVINRTKALWAGRKGPRLTQSASDLWRLLAKRPVISAVTTPIFRLAPLVVLATALLSGLLTPLLGLPMAWSFPFDFVVVAYLWGLGRMFLVLGALDTGSAFEGMGASREAIYSALVEPVLFLALGTLAVATGHSSFADLVSATGHDPGVHAAVLLCAASLAIVLQVEAARGPVDDPSTHLELTMIHEVMILDHSGPDLAALQYGSAVKLVVVASIIAGLLNPLGAEAPAVVVAGVNLVLVLALAIVVGCIESLTARIRLRAVPQYIVAGGFAAIVGLLAAFSVAGRPA